MAVKKKIIETQIRTIKESAVTPEFIEVELNDIYKNYSGIHLRYTLVSFKNNKAKVSQETADKLREQGFIK